MSGDANEATEADEATEACQTAHLCNFARSALPAMFGEHADYCCGACGLLAVASTCNGCATVHGIARAEGLFTTGPYTSARSWRVFFAVGAEGRLPDRAASTTSPTA